MTPSPCPECLSAGEYDRSNPDRCVCTNPECGLVYPPVPVFEETRQPYKDGE